MDDTDFSEDFEEVEVIYSDGEDDDHCINEYNEDCEGMSEDNLEDNDDETSEEPLFFRKHNTSVFCGDVTKNGELAATGGQDDIAYVWYTKTKEVYMECTGHKDSVFEVSFNHDNQLLATADLAGLVQVWKLNEKKLVWCSENDQMTWMIWHSEANIILGGFELGDVFIWKIPEGHCKVLPSSGECCTSAQLLSDGKRLAVGYSDGSLKLWDIKDTSVVWNKQVEENEVTSLAISADNTLISSAPSSSLVKISDGKIIASFSSENCETEAHLFNDDLKVLITGSLSGLLRVWDIGKLTMRHQTQLNGCITVMKQGPSDIIYVGATGGHLYMYDIRTGVVLQDVELHKKDILSICPFKDYKQILTTSDDGKARISDVETV